MDYTFQGPFGTVSMPGICSSVRRFMSYWNNIQMRNYPRYAPNTWTFNWDLRDQSKRKSQSCPGKDKNPCFIDNQIKKLAAFGPSSAADFSMTSCDEFPFASTEEGGKGLYGLNPEDPGGTTRTCVPFWQNTMQGNCNG